MPLARGHLPADGPADGEGPGDAGDEGEHPEAGGQDPDGVTGVVRELGAGAVDEDLVDLPAERPAGGPQRLDVGLAVGESYADGAAEGAEVVAVLGDERGEAMATGPA